MKFIRVGLAVVLGIGGLASQAWAGTAFQTQPVAEKVISPSVRGKLIWARATEGTGIDPYKWSYLFYDPYAEQNGRNVVVINGAVSSIKEGFVDLDHARLLSYKTTEIMPESKLKLDSNQALAAVQSAAKIENVPLTTVHYKLEEDGDNDVPVWTVMLYKMVDGKESKFCTAKVSAFTGQIFSLDVDRAKL